jgi:hypothetical protein
MLDFVRVYHAYVMRRQKLPTDADGPSVACPQRAVVQGAIL